MRTASALPMLALSAVLASAGSGRAGDGARLPDSPIPPGFPPVEFLPRGVLPQAVASYQRGDLGRARVELEALVAGKSASQEDRIRAAFLLGWIDLRLGHFQQASSNFYRVRKDEKSPLREFATMLEARADLLRGHGRTALAECDAYGKEYPEGLYLDECALIAAQAQADLGALREAAALWEAFLEAHPDDQRGEEIALRLARAQEESGSLSSAAARYRALYLQHALPNTGVEAEAALRRLEATGVAVQPLDDDDLYVRACSLRRAGLHDASYALYCDLDARNPGEGEGATALGKRLDDERHEFLWRNRRYLEVGESAARAYQRAPDGDGAPENLWWAVQGYSRSGRFDEAIRYQELGRGRFADHGRFRNSDEVTALLYLGGGRYADARASYSAWREASASARRSTRVEFLLAYCAYRAGDREAAETELRAIADDGVAWASAASWYLGKLLDKQKDRAGARAAWDAVLSDEPDGWYAQLVRAKRRREGGDLVGRDGRWPGPRPKEPSPPLAALSGPEAVQALWSAPAWDAQTRLVPGRPERRDLAGRPEPVSERTEAPKRTPPPLPSDEIPETWAGSPLIDLATAHRALDAFVLEHSDGWEELLLLRELARIGLAELAGPMMAGIWREVREVQKNKAVRRKAQRARAAGPRDVEGRRLAEALDLTMRAGDWVQLLAAAGYPHGVAAWTDPIDVKQTPRNEANRGLWALRWPYAFAPDVWRAAWRENVDPLMILAVMRAESMYRHDAISPAGAIGLVQVMPATGSKLAALLPLPDFRVERLLEPAVNIELGGFYLGKLLDRFGPGQFPLAIGSYNGGPHNIGRWLRPKVGIDLDEFVEEIAFDESRDYVKKVTSYYAVYADLWAEESLALPERTRADDPTVIDF